MVRPQHIGSSAIGNESALLRRLLSGRAKSPSCRIALAGSQKDSLDDIHSLLSVLKQSLMLR